MLALKTSLLNIQARGQSFYLKGTYYGKFTFTWCFNINVCLQCVSKTTLE